MLFQKHMTPRITRGTLYFLLRIKNSFMATGRMILSGTLRFVIIISLRSLSLSMLAAAFKDLLSFKQFSNHILSLCSRDFMGGSRGEQERGSSSKERVNDPSPSLTQIINSFIAGSYLLSADNLYKQFGPLFLSLLVCCLLITISNSVDPDHD